MMEKEKLLSRDFIAVNAMIFLAYTNLAVFFNFEDHLQSLPIDPRWIGFLIAIFSLSGIILRPIISPFLFPGNARRWIAFSTLADIIALFAYSAAGTFWPILAVRLINGTAYVGMAAAKMALIVAFIPPRRSGQAFGITSACMLLPFAVIPPLLDPLGRLLGGFDRTLAATGFLMILIYPLLLLIRPQAGFRKDSEAAPRHISRREYWRDLKDPRLLITLAIILVLFFCLAAVFVYCRGFGISIGIRNPGLFFTLAIFTMILIRFFGGPYFDRLPKEELIIAALGGLTLAYFGLSMTRGSTLFYGLAFLCGICWGIAHPLLHAVLFRISDRRFQPLNQNLGTEMVDSGFFFGPMVGGFFLAGKDYPRFFLLCAAVTGISLIAFLIIFPRLKAGIRDKSNTE